MKTMRRTLFLLILAFSCLLLLFTACGEKQAPALSPEDVVGAYKAQGYAVTQLDPAGDSSGDSPKLPYGHYLIASKGEESIYFYFFATEEEAEDFKEEKEWNLLLWFYSLLYNDPTWVHVKRYGCLVATYEEKTLTDPLLTLLQEPS